MLYKKISLKIKNSINNPLIINILSVGIIALIVKIISFYKETVIASSFGLSELLDTFYIAILIPSFIQNVFVGALKNLFIPNYIAELKTTKQVGSFQSVIFLMILTIVSILVLLVLLFSKYLLSDFFPGHTSNYYNLISSQLNYVLPCLFFWGLSKPLEALLEIKNKFILASITPIFSAISTITSLIFFKDFFQEKVLVFGILSGSIISFFFLLIICLKRKVINLKKPKLNANSKIMIKQLAPKITSGFLTGINPFVDQFFAAQLVIGSIAAINYGMKIPSFVIGILILALGNVLLPHFSRLINENLSKAYKQLFKILKLIFIGSAAIILIAIFLSENIIELLFQRKEFTKENTFIVANIQKIALIYVPFYLCTLVTVKFLTSINKNSFMAWVSFWNLILNLILNYILIKKYGIYGLVISTAIVYIICSFIYVSYAFKQFKSLKKKIEI